MPQTKALKRSIITNWAYAQSYPAIGAAPPNEDEYAETIGSNSVERAMIIRSKFSAHIAGYLQTIDTVRLSWKVPHEIRRIPGNGLQVHVHVPLNMFGNISYDEYCNALVEATMGLINPAIGPIHSQVFVFRYFRALLRETIGFLENLPTHFYDINTVNQIRKTNNVGMDMVLDNEYPRPSPRWAFDMSGYNDDDSTLRIDVKAPNPHDFMCVVAIPLGSDPHHQPAGRVRRQWAISALKGYIQALDTNLISGQYLNQP